MNRMSSLPRQLTDKAAGRLSEEQRRAEGSQL